MIKVLKWSLLEFKDRGRPCKLCNSKKSVKYEVTIRYSNRLESRLITMRVCNKCIGKILAIKEEGENSDESSKIGI